MLPNFRAVSVPVSSVLLREGNTSFHSGAHTSICLILGFLAARVVIILMLTPGTAKSGVGLTAQEHLLAVLAQAKGLVFVH